jgi:hypothetical protein
MQQTAGTFSRRPTVRGSQTANGTQIHGEAGASKRAVGISSHKRLADSQTTQARLNTISINHAHGKVLLLQDGV